MISVVKEIEKRTCEHPDKLLFAFLDIRAMITESYTYASFEQRTHSIAGYIHTNYNLAPGDRVLLAYPPGLEMICTFFAAVKLGLIPVPVYPPSEKGLEASVHKMNFIAQDCGANAVLTDRSCFWSYQVNLSRNKTSLSDMEWIVTENADSESSVSFPEAHSDILFLQYTSGSTNDPKGVMVTHDNIIRNCKNVVDHLPVGVSWLPQYHDMGLIGYYLFFALKGGTTYGFSPADFIQRPALWLEAITKFRATASSAPNFAYEYCLMPGKIPEETIESFDLSSLRFLMTAAEPIKPAVYHSFLDRFIPLGLKPESFFGAYGLAEFTLAVTNYGRTSHVFDAALLRNGIAKIWYHAYQHIYATFIYGLLLIEWLTVKDFVKVIKYYSMGFFNFSQIGYTIGIILVKKMLFYLVFLFVPLKILPFEPLVTAAMFLTMLVAGGISMTIVFQLAHVVPCCGTENDTAQLAGKNWHVHQLETTCNFAHKNKLVSYLIGGLNYQVEHHLFPHICHVHYPAIAAIVKQTAGEFGVPYHYESTFRGVVKAHYRHLRNLGRGNSV